MKIVNSAATDDSTGEVRLIRMRKLPEKAGEVHEAPRSVILLLQYHVGQGRDHLLGVGERVGGLTGVGEDGDQ